MKIAQKDNYSKNSTIKCDSDLKKSLFFKGNSQINPIILEAFELQEYLGSGRESSVYKAFIKSSKRTVAMKVISLEENQKKNMNEIKISKKLKNKNIINFHIAGELIINRLYCLITDYADFGNLNQFKNKINEKNNFSESLICYLAYQILKGLKYCHLNKIIHFDLKPQNILIDNSLNVKLIDFSVSLDYSKIKTNEIKLPVRGTYFYMAPEVINSEIIPVTFLNKVDLFSLGIILYNLAFNSFPFYLNKNNERIKNDLIINNENNYYSSHFIDFLYQLLEPDINKRIDIYEALNNYWIKGAEILFEEKEKLDDDDKFLNNLIFENVHNFHNYLNKKAK